MALVDFLLAGAQPAYAAQIEAIARRWDQMLGPAAFAGADNDDFIARVLARLEAGDLSDEIILQVVVDLMSVVWWRGPAIDDATQARLSALVRRVQLAVADRIILPAGRSVPLSKTRRAHTVFVGELIHPFHSPSRGAIDYLAALALDANIERIEVYHAGRMTPQIQAYVDERLGVLARRRGLVFVSMAEDPDFLVRIVQQGPCTFHFWCENALAMHVSIAARLGPTVMFTCGDEPPFQYADVYWFFHSADHMRPHWERRGAPESFVRNYVQSVPGPFYDLGPPAPRSRAEVGLPEDAFVIATVGNRLAIDLDEAFVSGLELTMRSRPQCIWLVVGDLPENLLAACRQVLGDQFRHIPVDLELARLMTTADVFANPFRNGGGNSAMIALTAGAVLLTTDSGDVAAMAPEAHRARDADDYFARLAALIDNRDELEAWRGPQQDHMRTMTDQRAFLGSLKSMVTLAHERFTARGDRKLTAVVNDPQTPAALRAAS